MEAVERMYSSDRVLKLAYWSYIFLFCTNIHDQILSATSGKKTANECALQIKAVAGNVTSWIRNFTSNSWTSHLSEYLHVS
ncbi:hypothetical protein DPMN_054241 [Dreissena polymorpha]|uniref:Uncharacterized protein n=1 Tax=Dreissena polymorpha TaxID=45954 RepID=A0A9D4CPI6_DREPO|nr:hypothetical protein DPMN_054241 [Dreissena polymorpha]